MPKVTQLASKSVQAAPAPLAVVYLAIPLMTKLAKNTQEAGELAHKQGRRQNDPEWNHC